MAETLQSHRPPSDFDPKRGVFEFVYDDNIMREATGVADLEFLLNKLVHPIQTIRGLGNIAARRTQNPEQN